LSQRALANASSVRAKVDHLFRVLKCQLAFTKLRDKGWVKNAVRFASVFSKSNLSLVKKRIIQGTLGWFLLRCEKWRFVIPSLTV